MKKRKNNKTHLKKKTKTNTKTLKIQIKSKTKKFLRYERKRIVLYSWEAWVGT